MWCVLPAAVSAQGTTVVGTVRSAETGAMLPHVIVTLNEIDVLQVDSTGGFRFGGVSVGPHTLSVRGIGRRPVSMLLLVPPNRSEVQLTIRLFALPVRLAPIEVVATAGAERLAREGFFDRRNLGFGHFVTRAEIEKRDPQNLSVFLSVLPRRFRSSCALWIDGVPAETLGNIIEAVDLLLPPVTVAGLEVYSGGANTPIRFNNRRGRCSVVVWTR